MAIGAETNMGIGQDSGEEETSEEIVATPETKAVVQKYPEGRVPQGKIPNDVINGISHNGATKVAIIGDIRWLKPVNQGTRSEGQLLSSVFLTKEDEGDLTPGKDCYYMLDFPVYGYTDRQGSLRVCSYNALKVFDPEIGKDEAGDETELR